MHSFYMTQGTVKPSQKELKGSNQDCASAKRYLIIILWGRIILERTSRKIHLTSGLTNTNPMFNNHMVSDLLLSFRRYNFFSTASLNA